MKKRVILTVFGLLLIGVAALVYRNNGMLTI